MEWALCERYYQVRAHVVTTENIFTTVPLRQYMRAVPIIATTFDQGTGATFIALGNEAIYQNTNHNQVGTATLRLSAEL
jgi:hypothetical protein